MILTLSTYVINYLSNLKIKFSEPSTYAHLLDWCGSLPVDCLVPWSPGARITGLFSQENNMTNGTFIQVFFFCMLFSLEGDTPETAWSHKTNFPYSAEPSVDIHTHFIGPFWTLLQLHEPYEAVSDWGPGFVRTVNKIPYALGTKANPDILVPKNSWHIQLSIHVWHLYVLHISYRQHR